MGMMAERGKSSEAEGMLNVSDGEEGTRDVSLLPNVFVSSTRPVPIL